MDSCLLFTSNKAVELSLDEIEKYYISCNKNYFKIN